jgi:hypothetical protein
MNNFTLQDVVGSAFAVAIFAFALYMPGYVLGYAANLFDFRRLGFRERTMWAIAYSFATIPLLGYLIGKYAGLTTVCGLLIGLAFAWVVLVWRERRELVWSRIETLAAWAAGLWIVFVILSLVDIQVGHKLYVSVVEYDQSYRVAFTDSVLRTGVPPANPLYFAGHAQPMRYYYFWYVVCAMVARIGHVSARQAFLASSVWAGFGMAALLGLYMRHFLGVVENVRRQTVIAIALLVVTGADLLPAIGSIFVQRSLNGDMEWWSNDQISSWADSVLWVPHHVASLLCCMVTFLSLWITRSVTCRTQRVGLVLIAAVAFTSAFGLSIYVAFGFAVLMLAWMARLVSIRVRDTALAVRVVAAGAISVVLLAPYVKELIGDNSWMSSGGNTAAAHVLAFSIRRMIDPALLTGLPIFTSWNSTHAGLLDVAARLLLLPLGLALELGFYGVVLWLYAAQRKNFPKDGPQRTALYLTGCGLLLALFVRSAVLGSNDFGYRVALLAQFFLLVLASDLLAAWWIAGRSAIVVKTRVRTRLLYGLMALGLAGTMYQVVLLRVFVPIEEALPGSGYAALLPQIFQARTAFATLDRIAGAAAVVEFNPVDPHPANHGDEVPPYVFYSRSIIMNAGRQILSAEPQCAAEFGGDTGICTALGKGTRRLYALPAPSAEWAEDYCRQFGADYLAVGVTDPAWSDPLGWAATLPAVVSEAGFRIVRCRAN